jgi:hypothetical protein
MKRNQIAVLIISYSIGAIGGLIYYNLYSCDNGCAITSNPYLSMLAGAFIGGFLIQFIYEKFFIKS